MQDENATSSAERDEGHRQLKCLIEAASATRTLFEQQISRHVSAMTPVERGDVLHASIIAIEGRLIPRCRLADLTKVRDARHIIAGRQRI